MSAEVDHVVVGPSGVWLLETKCWGRRFVAGEQYFDPFEQVDRAGLLCHILLRNAALPANVRRVVVPFGDLPEPPPDTWTRVVPPERVRRWIECGRPCLHPGDAAKVASFLWDNFAA
jgi:hypothetical protein